MTPFVYVLVIRYNIQLNSTVPFHEQYIDSHYAGLLAFLALQIIPIVTAYMEVITVQDLGVIKERDKSQIYTSILRLNYHRIYQSFQAC